MNEALSILLCLAGLAGGAPAGPTRPLPASSLERSARETVKVALDRVTEILLSDELDDRAKRSAIMRVVDQNADFDVVARLVLARNWRKFSEPQTREFIELFRRHLLQTYWKSSELQDFQGIDVVKDRKEPRRDWTVMTVVHVRGRDDVRVDYRLRRQRTPEGEDGDWKIIDILVEGVSLISNFRSQFQSIVSNEGPEGLLRLLKEKVEEAERAESAGD